MSRLKMNTIFIVIIGILFSSLSIGYSALSTSVKITGNASYNHVVQAINLSYINTYSGLSATTAQEAIDQIESKFQSSGISSRKVFKLKRLDEDDNSTVIATYSFPFTQGMTWEQYISSSYNTSNEIRVDSSNQVYHYASDNYIRYTNDTVNETIVLKTETIQAITYIISDYLCCFDPDTLITIDLEGNTKKIKDIEVGDTIVVENVNTKEKHLTTVLKDASEHPQTYDITELSLESGTKLKFNSYHPIYTTEGYKSVTNYNHYPTLEEGDYAVDSNNNPNKIIKIKRYKIERPEMTYNLLIKGINEFYLEEEYSYIANNTLVHTGIAKYDDEDEWREKNRYKCTQQNIYQNFNYDDATDEELIKYLVELKVENESAFNEYIKYYISADQYYRYAKLARIIKTKAKEVSNINTLHHIRKNNKLIK